MDRKHLSLQDEISAGNSSMFMSYFFYHKVKHDKEICLETLCVFALELPNQHQSSTGQLRFFPFRPK